MQHFHPLDAAFSYESNMANKFLPILVKLQKESAKESDAKQDNCRAAILS